MKKVLCLVLILFVAFVFGCVKKSGSPAEPVVNTPTVTATITAAITNTATITLTRTEISSSTATLTATPTATQTETLGPVVISPGTGITGFESGVLSFTAAGVGGNFYGGNDSSAGGSSSISAFGLVSPGNAGSYGAGVTATVATSIAGNPGSSYAYNGSTSNYCGYATLNVEFNDPVNISSCSSFSFYTIASQSAGWAQRVYFYAENGDYFVAQNWYMVYTTWGKIDIALGYLEAPYGESYTLSSVLSKLKKIVIVVRTTSATQGQTFPVELYYDQFAF
jgi:hypothetical protein